MGRAVSFGSMSSLLTKGPSRSRPAQASFKVQPKMTKWEVKEYLTKIYNLPVKKVGGTFAALNIAGNRSSTHSVEGFVSAGKSLIRPVAVSSNDSDARFRPYDSLS